jgi:Family of unknown function (DUF5302)
MPAEHAPEANEDPQAGSGEPDGPVAEAGADDDLKAKYRDALAHKHSSHGAEHGGHEDRDSAPRGHGPAHSQRMFRRKAGG